MKRSFMALTIVCLTLLMVATGCGKKVKKIDNERYEKEFEHAPEWVIATPHADEAFSAVGSAHIGKGGIQFARTEALSNARSELARQVSVKVRGLVNTVAQQAGFDDQQSLDAYSKQVSKQVTDEILSGSRQKDMWISPSEDIYVLAILEKADIKNSVRRQMTSKALQGSVRLQMPNVNEANAELDAEIEKAFEE